MEIKVKKKKISDSMRNDKEMINYEDSIFENLRC